MELRTTKIIVAKPKLAGDRNNDGIVIIFDLVIVTGKFGQSLASPAGETEIKLTTRRQLTTLQEHHIVAA